MQDSHTPVVADETTDPDRLRLVPTTTLGLAERLAGRLDGHLARFAEHLREGLLAASTAVGLEVMAELMAAEVTDLAGPKGKHNPAGQRSTTANSSQVPWTPFNGWMPRSSRVTSDPTIRSRTVREVRISPDPAVAITRAAMWTAIPGGGWGERLCWWA
jgi:hypothetical protein